MQLRRVVPGWSHPYLLLNFKSRTKPDKQTCLGVHYHAANVTRMRKSLRFVLKGDQHGGSILGEPGKTRTELADMLKGKCGDLELIIEAKKLKELSLGTR